LRQQCLTAAYNGFTLRRFAARPRELGAGFGTDSVGARRMLRSAFRGAPHVVKPEPLSESG
jgi:hypothetical protein